MEVYEIVNLHLRDNKITKKEFAQKLRNLEPKLRNTGEIPSEKSIYAYLTGRIGIKIELIPYIAEVLQIPAYSRSIRKASRFLFGRFC
jgi:hypothetical protein